MTAHPLHSLQRNPNHAVGWCIRRLKQAHYEVFFGMLLVGVEVQAVIGPKPVAPPEMQFARRKTTDDRFAQGRIEESSSVSDLVLAAGGIFGARKEIWQSTDNSKSAVIVAHSNRQGQLDARIPGNFLEVIPSDVRGRCFQMKDRIEDDLELRTAGAQNRIESTSRLRKRAMDLIANHPDRKQQTSRQCHRCGSEHGGQRMLAQAL